MLLSYKLFLYTNGTLIEVIPFQTYDDFSATHKAARYFKVGNFDVVDLSRGPKTIKVFKKEKNVNGKK